MGGICRVFLCSYSECYVRIRRRFQVAVKFNYCYWFKANYYHDQIDDNKQNMPAYASHHTFCQYLNCWSLYTEIIYARACSALQQYCICNIYLYNTWKYTIHQRTCRQMYHELCVIHSLNLNIIENVLYIAYKTSFRITSASNLSIQNQRMHWLHLKKMYI